jgi:hypothetical protein
VADYEFVWAGPEDAVRWEGRQQHTMAAHPAAAAPANRTIVPKAAVPVSTVAQSNNLFTAFPPCISSHFRAAISSTASVARLRKIVS